MTLRVATLVAGLLIARPPFARGECVIPPPICRAFERAGQVFLADVAQIDWEERTSGLVLGPRVTFDVVELFKGVGASQIGLRFSGSPEEFSFRTGTRTLVYAERDPAGSDRWTARCSRTRLAASDDAEVAVLRRLATSTPGAAVFGSIERRGRRPPSDLQGIRVRVSGPSGSSPAVLEWNVRYELGWLPPGRYVLHVEGERVRAGHSDFTVGAVAGCVEGPRVQLQPK